MPEGNDGPEGKLSALYITIKQKHNQNQGTNEDNEVKHKEATKEPIIRKSALPRKPPRATAQSLLEIGRLKDSELDTEIKNITKKRRRTAETPEIMQDSRKTGQVINAALKGFIKEIRNLNKEISKSYKPKNEFREIASKMSLIAETLRTRSQEINAFFDRDNEELKIVLENENRLLKDRIAPSTVEACTNYHA